jgi:O-antigen ligase/polysaccharide polymerase Wzy-like membrane protein
MLILQRWIAFAAGLFLECNILVGGQTEGAAAAGGYGYRVSDFVCIICCLLAVTLAYNSNRIFSAYVYVASIVLIFAPVVLMRNDYTVTIGIRYVMYSISGLYLASIVTERQTMNMLCYGMICGLCASVGVFVLQNASIPKSTLLSWGLIAGYAGDFGGYIRETPRYSGLWGHPNEAGHAGALAAAAAAYLYFVERRLAPIAIVAAGFVAFFYYTLSRGGLIAGMVPIAVAIMIPRSGRITDPKFLVGLAAIALIVLAASQLDFLFARFTTDANAEGNVEERLGTMIAGFQIALSHPLGLSVTDFISELDSLTGGVASPHNGFIFIGAVLGAAPLIAIVWAVAKSFMIEDTTDIFFAFLSLQIFVSNMFEQVPGSIPYIFALTLLIGHAFLKTRLGSIFRAYPAEPSRQMGQTLAP